VHCVALIDTESHTKNGIIQRKSGFSVLELPTVSFKFGKKISFFWQNLNKNIFKVRKPVFCILFQCTGGTQLLSIKHVKSHSFYELHVLGPTIFNLYRETCFIIDGTASGVTKRRHDVTFPRHSTAEKDRLHFSTGFTQKKTIMSTCILLASCRFFKTDEISKTLHLMQDGISFDKKWVILGEELTEKNLRK
jgi:hypothetical protein